MKNIAGILVSGMGTGRCFFGPMPPKTFVSSVTMHCNVFAGAVANVSVAAFYDKPADTAAAFSTGEHFCIATSFVSGSPACPLFGAVGANVICPLGFRVDQFRWLGVQFSTVMTASFFVVLESDVGRFTRLLKSEPRQAPAKEAPGIIHIPKKR